MGDQAVTVPAQLGSILLSAQELFEARTRQRAAVSTSCTSIDRDVLDGGFRHGEISSIAGLKSTGKTLLSYHVAANQLLDRPDVDVAFIDTLGSFSPLRMRDVIASNMRSRTRRPAFVQAGYSYKKYDHPADTEKKEIRASAFEVLDRVKIMRVFDLAGIAEALAEIEKSAAATGSETTTARPGETGEIADSEDELSGGSQPDAAIQRPVKQSARQIGMIVIDTIANVGGVSLSKSQIHGQSLLVLVMRSLRRLVLQQNMCAIVINEAVDATATASSWQYSQHASRDASIFASTRGKPALGACFACEIDIVVFLARIPKTTLEAVKAFREGSVPGSWQQALIFEVLTDRVSQRAGKWTSFEIDDVGILPCSFERQ